MNNNTDLSMFLQYKHVCSQNATDCIKTLPKQAISLYMRLPPGKGMRADKM